MSRGPKTKGYRNDHLAEQLRRERAAARAAERAKRTPEQQLQLITSRPGESRKERARLEGEANGHSNRS